MERGGTAPEAGTESGRVEWVGAGGARADYPVIVGAGLLGSLDELVITHAPAHGYAIIADETVAALYGEAVVERLAATAATVRLLTFSPGERHKNRDSWTRLTDALLETGFGRDSVVVALGGGVTGDLAGFVAATFLRGVPVVQVPTSLVAMIDASVGGKTGVDTGAGKNLVGAFHPPKLVVVDPTVVRTLPRPERAQGLAEAVKHGAVLDAVYFGEIEEEAGALLDGDPDATERVVRRSVELKAGVVTRDEREGGLRQVLNFGHTLGHALEATSDYRLPHGSAISVGMVLEAALGEALGVTEPGTEERLARALRALELPTSPPAGLPTDAVLAFTRADKKGRAGRPRYVVLRAIGAVAGDAAGGWSREVQDSLVAEVLTMRAAAAGGSREPARNPFQRKDLPGVDSGLTPRGGDPILPDDGPPPFGGAMALPERYRDFTVASALAHRATTDPERPFILFGGEDLTFGEVDARADAMAAALHGLGIEAGDRIALLLPAWPEFVVSVFAAAKLGAVVVPLNPLLTYPELRYMLRHSEAVAAVAVETLQDVDYLELFEDLLVQLPELQYLVTVGEADLWYDDRIFQFEDLLSAGVGRDYPAPDDGDEEPSERLFAILYTSGTTGKPKGVGLSHANLLRTAGSVAEAIGLGPDDRIVGMTALFHVFGMGPGILGTLLSGASLVLQDELDGGATLDLIERHGATVQYGIPTLFATELTEQSSSPRDLGTLRLGVAAGAPVGERLVREVEARLCPELLVAYSLTETSSAVSITRPGDPGEKRRFTVGRPLSETEVRVLERDGSELPVESVGEIAVRGPGIMKGYYRQPQETSASMDGDGFLLTGDLGMVDEEGYIHLVGRRREVIIRSGFNVYPGEVEDRIKGHPGVREAAVVGVQDDVLGEAICACIVPVEGAIVTGREIKEWCRVTLADYKVPDLVRFLDGFPLTGTGKIRRVELARMMQAQYSARR